MIEVGYFKRVVEICDAVHNNAIKDGKYADIKIIKDKLFEEDLEISLTGHNETARKI